MEFGELDGLAGWNSGNWTIAGAQFGELDVWRDGIREIGRLAGRNSGNWTFGGMEFGEHAHLCASAQCHGCTLVPGPSAKIPNRNRLYIYIIVFLIIINL